MANYFEKISVVKDKHPSRRKKWLTRWNGGLSESGTFKRNCRSFQTKAEAERFAEELSHQFHSGEPRDPAPKKTLHEFCQEFLKYRKFDLRASTYDIYLNTIERLYNYFGKSTYLTEITPQAAALFISTQKNMSHSVKNNGKDLSPNTRYQLKRTCKALFEVALDWDVIKKNPFRSIKSKKMALQRWHQITVDEYHRLIEVAPDLRWKAYYALAYTSAGRTGELFSLMWSDIDFNSNNMLIQERAATDILPPFLVKDYEKRQIILPAQTIDILAQWQEVADEEVPYVLLDKKRFENVKKRYAKFKAIGKPWQNKYMVNNLRRDFLQHVQRAGIRPVGKIHPHVIRKSCCQNWADRLPIHVVKELMGHSSIVTTQTYYTQVDPEQELRAAKVIEEMLAEAEN